VPDRPDLAVLALGQGDADPQVGAGGAVAGLVDHRLDGTIADAVHRDPGLEGVEPVLGDAAEGPGPVAPDQARGGKLQRPRQPPVVGQEEKALGGQVKAADRDEAGEALGQGLEDGGPALGILVRGHQARGLVVAEEADGLGIAHHLAVDGQDVAGVDPDGGRRQGPAVDGHPALGDQALDLAP